MSWSEHVVWWQVYPLGFVGAPVHPDQRQAAGEPVDGRLPADTPVLAAESAPPTVVHRLPRLLGWLDHLVGLGANGLLLGPVFDSATHGYDTLDHLRLDPRLGDDGDLDALVAACHARGIKVALDGVFNHVADTHPRYLQALAEGPGGRYADWFAIDWAAEGGPRAAVFEGHGSLVALNHANPQVADYVVQVMNHWCDRGVDAWRLDAAYAVPTQFWADVLPRVRAQHPDVWVSAEVIHGDQAAFVADSGVDSLTQYPLWKATWSSLLDANFFELDWALGLHGALPFAATTFVGNHDVTRIASKVGPERAVLALVVLATVAGVPTVYAGDELAWTGVKEERVGGDDAIRPEFAARPELGDGEWMYRVHQELIGLRRRHPWLVHATTRTLELTNTRYVYAPTSPDGADSLVVELDVSGAPRAEVRTPDGATLFRYPS